MKKILNILLVFLYISIIVLCMGNTFSFAKWDPQNELINKSELTAESNMTELAQDLGGTAITVTRVIAMGIGLVMLIILGIKYMTSAPSDKAQVIKHAWVYFVGALIMFASSGIITFIAETAQKLSE